MFISSIFLVLALILITTINRKNRYTYIIALFLFSVALLVVVCALYVSKISTYYFPLKIDYHIFLALSKVKVHIFTISRLYNISIAIFMTASVIFYKMLSNQRLVIIFALMCPIAYFLVINDPNVTWDLYIVLHSVTEVRQALLNSFISINKTLCEVIILFYIALPLAYLGKYFFSTKLRIKRMNSIVLASCFLFIDIFFYSIVIKSFFENINNSNIDLTKFPSDNLLTKGYITAPYYALLLVIGIIFIVLYYKPFNYVSIMKKIEANKNAAALSKDLKSVLHNYKNAFIGINRFTSTIENAIKAGNNDTVTECVDLIREISEKYITNISRTTEMLKNTSIEYAIINIPECINKAIAESGIPSNIKISVQTIDNQLFVLGDKYHLLEVFKNMFINSVQAIKKKQPESPEIGVSIFTEDMFCIVEITDNGCGIDSKDYKKIFRSFYTSKNYVAGSGIGLTYSRNVIRLHHGDIEVESELGKYTLFRIVLPTTNKARDLL